MPVNWVRGFRRLGWVVTVPLAGFFVLLFYGQTNDVVGYDRHAIAAYIDSNPWRVASQEPFRKIVSFQIRGTIYQILGGKRS